MVIDPDPDLVESLQERFASNGEVGVYAHAAGWMSATIVRAAKEHGQQCGGCRTCRDLSELLSGVAAVQILNPPVDVPNQGRAAATPTVRTVHDGLQRELLTVIAAARRRMLLVVIALVALAAATAAALVAKAVGM